ncbi:MAG: DNA polymerase III delta prime subunit [Candidatus Binatia bacterium]|jgi:DNA polymerase III delta prime subunit
MTTTLFLLYGPPGCGKTTAIIHLALNYPECVAIDLESLPNDTSFRKSFLSSMNKYPLPEYVFIGAAEVHPNFFPEGSKVVALYHNDREEYRARVERRNAQRTDKRDQDEMNQYDNIGKHLSRNEPFLTVDPAKFEGDFDGMARHIFTETAGVRDL